jgi:hypothetical protein
MQARALALGLALLALVPARPQHPPSALPTVPVPAARPTPAGASGAWSLDPASGAQHLEAQNAEQLFRAYGDFHARAVARTRETGQALPPVLLCEPMYAPVPPPKSSEDLVSAPAAIA